MNIIFLVMGILLVGLGLYIYKGKKYNLAYIMFYAKSMEKYSDKNNVKNKEEIAEFIGKSFILSGCVVFTTALVFLLLKFEEIYLIIPIILLAIYYYYNLIHINKIIKK